MRSRAVGTGLACSILRPSVVSVPSLIAVSRRYACVDLQSSLEPRQFWPNLRDLRGRPLRRRNLAGVVLHSDHQNAQSTLRAPNSPLVPFEQSIPAWRIAGAATM